MRTLVLLGVLAAGLPRVLTAQQGPCDKALATVEMRECLTAQLKLADSSLAHLEGSVKAQLSPSVANALDVASTAWGSYRKAECKALLDSYEGGHEGPVVQLACLVEAAHDRSELLETIYAGLLQ